MEPHFKSGLFGYAIVYFSFVCKDRKNHQTIYIDFFFHSDDHDFYHDAVTYVLWVRRRAILEWEASVCNMWSTWCQLWSMTERNLHIRCRSLAPSTRFLSARLAPSLMSLRHFDLFWVSSFQVKDKRSNHGRIRRQVRIIWIGFQ